LLVRAENPNRFAQSSNLAPAEIAVEQMCLEKPPFVLVQVLETVRCQSGVVRGVWAAGRRRQAIWINSRHYLYFVEGAPVILRLPQSFL
jgi:hypothetical protein